MPRESLTPKKVSEILDCSVKTVYRKIQSGALPAFRLDENGEIRVATVDLLAFRDRNKYRRRRPRLAPAAHPTT